MSNLRDRFPLVVNGAANTTHLLWVDRWIEVAKSGDSWTFKTGRDAARWLLWK